MEPSGNSGNADSVNDTSGRGTVASSASSVSFSTRASTSRPGNQWQHQGGGSVSGDVIVPGRWSPRPMSLTSSFYPTQYEAAENRETSGGRENNSRKLSADMNRICWVCFASDEDYESNEELSGGWLRPCKCRNTTKWVHQNCLQRWIDEKQRGNPNITVTCPQCSHPYVIRFPKQTKFIRMLELYEKYIQKSCPIIAATFAAGAVYWTAVSYGAFTIMEIFGPQEGLELLEKGDPLFLLIVMPAIPVCLVLGKLVRWEDLVLKLWRKHSERIYDFFQTSRTSAFRVDNVRGGGGRGGARDPVEAAIMSDPVSATRVLCGALVLPTISLLFGKLLFRHVQPNLQRTILGGISFIVCKGILKMYLRQQQFLRTLKRQIDNYDEPPPPPRNVSSSETTNTMRSNQFSATSLNSIDDSDNNNDVFPNE